MADQATAYEAGLLRYLDVLAELARREEDPTRVTDALNRMEWAVKALEMNRLLDRIEEQLGVPPTEGNAAPGPESCDPDPIIAGDEPVAPIGDRHETGGAQGDRS